MQEIEISQCLFVFICKTGQPIKPIQQKSYLWNSIFFIFLKFPHQVDMKNIVKWTVVMGLLHSDDAFSRIVLLHRFHIGFNR